MTAVNLLRVACALLILIVAGPASLAGVTSLRLQSEPGEPLGGGQEFQFYTAEDGRLEQVPWLPSNSEEVHLRFTKASFPFLWELSLDLRMWFAAPPGETLAVGLYEDTVAPYQRAPGQPGLQVYGNARPCFGGTGRFEVKQIAFDPDGVLSRFWATFEQECGGLLRGEVRFNAEVPVELHAPSHRTARVGHVLEFSVQSHDGQATPVSLSATGLPQGATFTDAGDGSGRFAWLPEADQTGSAGWVAFTGEESDGGETDVAYTQIDAIPDFDDFDHPIPITTMPFDSTVYGPVASTADDDPICPAPEEGVPPPPADPDQRSAWYAFTPVEDGGIQLMVRASSPNASPGVPSVASLSVHAGERGALEPVACGRRSAQRFVARSGVTYHIMARFTPSAELRLAASALPPAPANDGFDDATVVGALPFSDAIDTTGAMFQSEPRHCIPPPPPPPGTGPGFGGTGSLVPPTNVWYAYAPTEDTRVTVNTSGSNYEAQITAFSRPRGTLVPLGCNPGRFSFTALAGRSYHVMIAGSFWPSGNDLQVQLTGRPALRIQAAIGAIGVVDRRTGTAFVHGVVECSRPAEVVLEGTLRQDRRRVHGSFRTAVACDGQTTWRAVVTGDALKNRPQRFAPGAAEVLVRASGVSNDDPDEAVVEEARAKVVLKTAPLR